MQRKDPIITGCYYHIYNRGNNRSKVFFDQENYLYFIKCMRKYFIKDTFELISYVLMPNNFHLLGKVNSIKFPYAIKNLSIAYTKAINCRYDRVGSLFQGPYKSKLIDKEEYLLYLSRHIHLNPVSAELVRDPADWEYSSYLDYIGKRNGSLPHPDIILDQFSFKDSTIDLRHFEYKKFVQDGISEKKHPLTEDYYIDEN